MNTFEGPNVSIHFPDTVPICITDGNVEVDCVTEIPSICEITFKGENEPIFVTDAILDEDQKCTEGFFNSITLNGFFDEIERIRIYFLYSSEVVLHQGKWVVGMEMHDYTVDSCEQDGDISVIHLTPELRNGIGNAWAKTKYLEIPSTKFHTKYWLGKFGTFYFTMFNFST